MQLNAFLLLAAALFSIGVYGVLARRNGVLVLMSIELILNAVNINLVVLGNQHGTVAGQALLKTGTLEGVRALAGYVVEPTGRRFTVVAIVNDRNAARAGPALDYLVQWVYRFAPAFAELPR